MNHPYLQRLETIRHLMEEKNWDALVISGSDPHNSEYVADRWKSLLWLSGFSGEGDLVITARHAGVWTDSRYFISGREELRGSGYELHETRVPDAIEIPEWLADHFSDEIDGEVVVCVDGLVQSARSVQDIRRAFAEYGFEVDLDEMGLRLVNCPDVLDLVWEDRKDLPVTPILTLGEELAGESRHDKLLWLQQFLADNDYGSILITALDEIAWLLNVRGSDIDYNPVVISYLLVTRQEVRWYVRKNNYSRLDGDTLDSFAELRSDGVEICPYNDVEIGISDTLHDIVEPMYVDDSNLNYNLFNIMTGEGDPELLFGPSPVQERKAVKNEVEIDGMREAHLEDGLVMERWLFWLESQVAYSEGLDEWQAACRLDEMRSQVEGFRDLSFETISAYGPNAASPHYVTPSTGSAILDEHGLYLCDSGGQYLYGTTDLTRTVPMGRCSALEREDYTLVLKGHIDLARAVFPAGTAGCQLDVLARQPLWKHKRNYGHGTGHGVGTYLNVHEGPQSFRQDFNDQPLLPGMVISDEPGMYREGRYGIRHENLLLCTDAGTNDDGQWLEFEVLTLCHIETSILDLDLLDREEIEWLNGYNQRVYDTLGPHLSREMEAWLYQKTRPVGKEG